MLPARIESDRFLLRRHRLDDIDAILEYASDEAWLRFLPIPMPYTRSDAERFVAGQALLDQTMNPSWAIEVDGKASGGINIRFTAEHRVAEIGYAVARGLWGKGFATEAARLVISTAFNAYQSLNKVRARADARNGASIRVMEKLGFKREGFLREERLSRGELADEAVYGVLRREWEILIKQA